MGVDTGMVGVGVETGTTGGIGSTGLGRGGS